MYPQDSKSPIGGLAGDTPAKSKKPCMVMDKILDTTLFNWKLLKQTSLRRQPLMQIISGTLR